MPESPHGPEHPHGCSGAIHPDGESSEKFCAGDLGELSWWRDCCEWDDTETRPLHKCVPKGKTMFS